MFTTLIESVARRRPGAGQGVVSLLLHVAVGVGAVHASRRILPVDPPRVYAVHPFVTSPEPRARVSPRSAGIVAPAEPVRAPIPDLPLPSFEPPGGLPPVDPGARFDPGAFGRGPTPAAPCPAGCGAADPGGSPAFAADAVDEPASVRSQPAPIYPPVLRAAGISGRVVLEFVVDTAGGVETGSVRSLESAHPAFEAAALAAIEGSRFVPARVRGRPVRQLVRQVVSFVVGR